MRIVSLLQHLLDASYLYAQNVEPLRHGSRGHILWALLLATTTVLAGWWTRRHRSDGRPTLAARVMFWSSLIGLILLALRVQTTGAFSARIWSLASTAIALGAPLVYWVSRWPWPAPLRGLGRAFAAKLSPDDAPLGWGWQLALGLVHLVGLSFLALRGGTGLGWSPLGLGLGCLLLVAWAQGRATGRAWWCSLRLEVLTPLAVSYVSRLLFAFVVGLLGVRADTYQAFPYPNPWAPWFDLRVMMLVGLAWTIIASGALLWRCGPSRRLGAPAWLGLAALGFGIVWYGILVAVHLTRGVTASDPYCYLQMAVDLAQWGTPLHEFPLIAMARENHLAVWPTVHVGYHALPVGTLAHTDWPIGWPMLMVPFYWLGGERGLLLAAPACALSAALLSWKLAQEIWPDEQRALAWLVGGVAALITLTSNEGAARTLVPMADAAVQVFSVLLLLCLARAHRRDRLGWSALAGASYALGYFVRHPQILLGFAALPVFLGSAWPWPRKIRHLLVFGLSALVCALPDLAYHTLTFGVPWKSESLEWFLLSWRNIPGAFSAVWREGWFSRVEFGYLLPLILCGAWQQGRRRPERLWAAMMGLGFMGVLGFNLFYGALRLRDLISLFPWLGLWAGRGIAGMWGNTRVEAVGYSRRVLVLLVVLFLFFARTTWALGMPWYPRLYIFGHLTQVERTGFSQLAERLPEGAVVGTSVNSGAVERYTGHEAVRPFSWSDDELARFMRALERDGRPFYLLEDGAEIQQFLPRLRADHTLRPVGQYTLPGFDQGSQWPERRAVLYAVER